jgi:hypothetical protein
MKLSKVELYIWGFNDEREVDPREALEYLEDRSRRDIVLVIGDTQTIEIPNPKDDNYPLNHKNEDLPFCRESFNNIIQQYGR